MPGRPEGDAVDLLVVGGGINGAGIARDATGRGLSVVLCEKDDLAQGTSSRSGKLIHGGLRYLEYFEFRLVREALVEREVLLAAAPHIIWPMRFVLPHDRGPRPAWVVRIGLFLYDHLGGRRRLPGTRSLDLRSAPEGRALKPQFRRAFEYSDCWVDDARLVVLNARGAADRGAQVLTRTTFRGARRDGGTWLAELEAAGAGTRQVRARAIVNAAGPWVENVLDASPQVRRSKRVRLVKGSHIVVRRFWDGPQAYLIQNADRRVIFVNPYEGDLALIGTTDIPFDGAPDAVGVDDGEVGYLCDVVNRYFRQQLSPASVIHAFSGVRPLMEDEADNPSAVTRDYFFDVDGAADQPAMLSIFGGKITTYRRLAEHALERLRTRFPTMGSAWTANAPLPGGDMPDGDFDRYRGRFLERYPWLPAPLAEHAIRCYGTLADQWLDGATSVTDLGRHFGAGLYQREALYLAEREWASRADDVLWRRTKYGLHMSAAEREQFAAWFDGARPGSGLPPGSSIDAALDAA